MATVGNLFVNVGASTAGLQRGMSAAKKQVDDFAKKAQGTLGNLGQVLPDMGGVTGYLSNAIDKFDALKDMAGVFTEGVKQAKKAQEELTKAIEASKAAEAALASAKGARRNVGMARAELAKQGIDPNKAAQALSIVDTSPLRDKVAKSAQSAAAAEKSLAEAQAAGAALTAAKHAEHLAAMRDKVAKASDRLATAENALKAAQYKSAIAKGGRDPWSGRFVAAQSAAKQAKAERDLARASESVASAMQDKLSAQDALNAAQAAGPVIQGQQSILAATNALTEAKKKQAEAERALGAARASNQAKEKTRASLAARGIDTTNLGKSLRLDDLSKYQKAVESAKASVADKQAAVSKLSGGFRAFGLVGKGAMLAVGATIVAAIAAVGGLLAVTKGAAKRMDALKDEAAATGMTVEGLQRLKSTYAELGVAEGVATMASQRLAISLEEAVQGGEEAREKFQRLGIDYKEIASMSPDDALAATIGKLRELGSSRQRVAALRDLFGRQGMGIAAAVNATNEELAKAQERAKRLVIPEQMVNDLADTNDSVEAMGAAFSNMSTMLGSTFSPVLRGLSDQLFEMMTADPTALLGGLQAIAVVCAVIYDVIALIVNAIRLVWNLVQAVAGIVVSALAAAFGAVLKVVQWIVYAVEWLTGASNQVSGSIGNAARMAFDTAAEAAKAAGSDAIEAWDSAVDAVKPDATMAVIDQIGKSWDKQKASMGEPVSVDIQLSEKARKDIESALKGLRDEARKLEVGDNESFIANIRDMGATEAQIEEAKALQAKITQLNIAKDISEKTLEIQDAIAKATMTAAEYEYQKARAAGADDQQASNIAAMQVQLQNLEKQKEQMDRNASTLEEMRTKVDEIGKSEREVLATRLIANNATQDQIDEAMRLQDILDSAKIDESVAKHFADLNDKLLEIQGGEAALLEQQLRNMGLVGDALSDAVSKSLDIQKQITAAEKAAADRKDVEDTLASLTEKFKDIGLDEVGKLTRRLTEAGASKDEIAKAAAMQKAIDAAGGEGKDAAAGVTDSVSTAIGNIALAGTVIDDSAWQDDLLAESMTQAELLAQIAANTAKVPNEGAQAGASTATVPAVRGVDRSETDLATILQQSLAELKAINSNTKAFSEVLS